MMAHDASSRRRYALAVVLLFFGWLTTMSSSAVMFETREFATPVDERRYRALIAELRCLVCQNQNLADSDAELAADLRDEVYAMILRGESDQQIVDFMVDRYGDFVLYRPPMKLTTAALWGGPALLLAGGLWLLVSTLRRARHAAEREELTPSQRRRLDELMNERASDGPQRESSK